MGWKSLLQTILIAMVLGLAILISSVSATEFATGETVYIIDTVTIDDDLFAGSQSATISGTIRGDLFVSGMYCAVDGKVDGSIMAFAYEFKLSGDCANSVRVFCRSADIDGHIERNLMAFSETFVLGRKGWVEKDIDITAGTATIQGRTGGRLRVNGGQVYLSGQVDGDVVIEAENVVVQPTAIIGGNLIVTSKNEPKIEPGAQILGETEYSLPEKEETGGYDFGDFLFDVWSLFALALVGGLIMAVCKGFTRELTNQITRHWLKSLGLGFVFFVCLPLAAAILFVTIVGVPLGVLTLAAWLALWYFSWIFTGIVVGEWTLKKLLSGKTPGMFWSMLLGMVMILLVVKIPYISFLLKLIVVFLAFGGFFLAAANRHAKFGQLGTPTE